MLERNKNSTMEKRRTSKEKLKKRLAQLGKNFKTQ